jgi:5'(3')-deoxyribonucleotidase
MKVAVDIDNVLVDTSRAVIDYINERIPINLKMEDIHDYYIEKALPEQYRWVIKFAFEDKEMWKKVKVIPEAVDYLRKLYDEGHEIYFVTSSLPSNLYKKIKHLERNLEFFPKNYIKKYTINTSIKQIIRADVLVDDCL